jgi:hypothetical protein
MTPCKKYSETRVDDRPTRGQIEATQPDSSRVLQKGDHFVKTLSVLCGLTLACLAASSSAADLQLEGGRLVVSGMLDGSAFKEFQAHLASGQVHTVVFENSMGGSPDVAADYANAIQATGVNTEARGQCLGACAFAFLAGKHHRFGHGLLVHALLIPVAQRPQQPGDLANLWQGPAASKTLAQFAVPAGADAANAPAGTLVASNAAATGAAPPSAPPDGPPAATAPKEHWDPNQGVLFTSTPTLFGRVYNSFYCDGTQGRDLSRCDVLPDTDPYKLGVLTPE